MGLSSSQITKNYPQLQKIIVFHSQLLQKFKTKISNETVKNLLIKQASQTFRIFSFPFVIENLDSYFSHENQWQKAIDLVKQTILFANQQLKKNNQLILEQKQGKYTLFDQDRCLKQIYYIFKVKTISGLSQEKTQTQLTLTYYFGCYVVLLNNPTIPQIKSLIGGTSLTKEEKKQAVKALVCDYLDKCEKN